MPLWYLDILADALPILQAEELITAVTAARAAHLDKRGYRDLINRLNRLAAPYQEDKPIRMAETPEDKAKAAAFFAAAGAKLSD